VQDECEKLSVNMKIGLTLFATNIPVVISKKTGYIDEWFSHSLDAIFIMWIVITGVAAIALVYPWFKCLTDYNRKHKLR